MEQQKRQTHTHTFNHEHVDMLSVFEPLTAASGCLTRSPTFRLPLDHRWREPTHGASGQAPDAGGERD